MVNEELRKKENKTKQENGFCFKIIALGGDAKSKVREAMVKIIESELKEANQLMATAEENITEARIVQQNLLTKDIKNNNYSVSAVLLNHAMDILITAESELSMITFILELMNKECIK